MYDVYDPTLFESWSGESPYSFATSYYDYPTPTSWYSYTPTYDTGGTKTSWLDALGSLGKIGESLLGNKTLMTLLGLGLTGAGTYAQTRPTTATGTQTTTGSTTPQLLPWAERAYREIEEKVLPYTRAGLAQPSMTPLGTSLYGYFGASPLIPQVVGLPTDVLGYLQAGQRAIERLSPQTLGAQWADIIAEQTLRGFTPSQQETSGKVRQAIADEIIRQASVPLALQRAAQESSYALQAARTYPTALATTATLYPTLMGLAEYPLTREAEALSRYLGTLSYLTGAPYGALTTGYGAGTTTSGGAPWYSALMYPGLALLSTILR